MYRVVLVDDENIIVEGLRRVVKWAEYNCEVVGSANDAQTGADLIRRLHPHILYGHQNAGSERPCDACRP